MKKIILIISLSLILLAVIVPASAAFADEQTQTYTVRFFVSEDNYTTQSVASGATPTPPAAPAKTGNTFKGWTLTPTAPNPPVISVSTYKVSGNVDFYAVFTPNTYKVTFKYYNSLGLLTSMTQSVQYGGVAAIPTVPQDINGSTFLGWDGDATAAITSATVYTASYNVQYFTVTYYGIDGEIIDVVSRSGLENVSDFEAPNVEQKKLRGWAVAEGSRSIINSGYRIKEDTALYAVYSFDIFAWFMTLELGMQILVVIGALFAVTLLLSLLKRVKR